MGRHTHMKLTLKVTRTAVCSSTDDETSLTCPLLSHSASLSPCQVVPSVYSSPNSNGSPTPGLPWSHPAGALLTVPVSPVVSCVASLPSQLWCSMGLRKWCKFFLICGPHHTVGEQCAGSKWDYVPAGWWVTLHHTQWGSNFPICVCCVPEPASVLKARLPLCV